MMNARSLAIAACWIGLSSGVHGQSLSQYRNFALGSDVPSVAALAGVDPAQATTVHHRPAVLQHLEWRPSSRIPGRATSQRETEPGALLARWGNSEHGVMLYQTSSYPGGYRLIVADARLDALARKAQAEAVRLDDQEAPAREIARQKNERDDDRVAAAKARAANKGVFGP